ncbi:DUF1742-domain-containing protein [Mycena crocata]|nr:DUF1742-domain-containing protein [Mycena crocata]
MSFKNLYYRRTAGTPKNCFICSKPSTTVLATIQNVDFIYTCPTHLTDPGFATSVVDSEPAKPSQEDVGKAIADWEDRQKRKKEQEEKKEKTDKDKDSKETDKDKAKTKDKSQDSKSEDSKDSAASPKLPGSLSPKATPTHERFILHRDIFSIRLGEHRKRRQTAQAKDLAPRLPGAPRGGTF